MATVNSHNHNRADSHASVIVVGAGPVGLLTALRLAQASISVILLEALPTIEKSPRAMAYQPVSVKELDRAGVLDEARRIGGRGRKVCWRKTTTQEVVAELERVTTPDHPYENLVIGQHELADVILQGLERFENSKVFWDHRVVAIEQPDNGGVIVTTENTEGVKKTFTSSYLVGADGGRSSVRKLVGVTFDGFTWPEQLVSTNVYFPFDKYWGEGYDGNFMIDKEHWALIARITKDGLWRVSYGELDGLSNDELRERLPWKFSQLFPGPSPPVYKLDQFSPYRLNQRCASSFRKGKVCLAGDAAHLCNPFGGLGLTGGILDAAALADALIAIHQGKADDEILEKYAETRQEIFQNIVNPQSQANKQRLHHYDVDTIGETDPFLKMLRETDAETKQKLRGHAGLVVDMSQFMSKAPAPMSTTAFG